MILAIYGAGGLGLQIFEMVDRWYPDRWDSILFINDLIETTGEAEDRPVMPYERFRGIYPPKDAEIVIGSGEPELRRVFYERVRKDGYQLATVIHPEAEISPTAILGNGVIALRGCVINHHARIGDNTCCMIYSVVGHDSDIAAHCQISTFVSIGGHCRMKECTFLGLHASVKDRLTIGRYAIIGQGSHVIQDVPDEVVMMGNPAKARFMNTTKRVFRL